MAAFSADLLAAIAAADFTKARPGPIGSSDCPACAVMPKVFRALRDTTDVQLFEMCVELGARHIVVGHPWDWSKERRYFLSRFGK